MSTPKLRLEWIEAGSLDENPLNWRRHSPEQLQSLRDLLDDPDVGWAGACLYNERTKRLIDGHARKSVTDPKQLVPVLVGDWSEEAEKKILITLDPVGAMAQGDSEAYAKLVEMVNAESLWVRDLIHNTQAGLVAAEEDDPEEQAEPSAVLPQMECQPFEHYDYIMLLFRNEQDFQQACERLGIQRVQVTYPGGKQKIGLGRCIDGMKALKILTAQTGGAQ
ncbi:MAG: hypothetical protein L6R28_03850 [Planctomycetes bacterium]|nr:hypothetical protein [Planctomycetota bacterium]